jgi:hypothetical protein
MTTVWSRWLLGAWAVATAVWLVVATLMLVQTWPEPTLQSADRAPFGQTGTPSRIDGAMRGRVGAATNVPRPIATALLIALLPPAILLMLVLGGMRLASLPLPSLRQVARKRSARAKS